jgi:hypothetical protein
MAQTKRKRRNKHRGNAVGVVEARGRTSKPGSTASTKNGRGTTTQRGVRQPLPPKEPSWKSAAMKAAFGCAILFVFFAFLSDGTTTGQALGFCAFAFVMYTPIMFYTDRFIYNRKMRNAKT